jgi:hypothetical protein
MTCKFCSGALGLLQEAVDAGLHFSPEEVRAMAAKAEKEVEEITEVLASRGYTQDRTGRWVFHSQVH